MALFRVSNERAQFDAAGNEASDQYGAGIRFTQGGNARVTTASPTNYNQGIPMSSTGQVAIVDATAGLPAGTIFHNGLPISGDKVCVSRNATAVVSNGLPFDSAGAVAADVNLDLNFIGTDTLNSSITFTRASTGTFFNSAGVLTSAAINAPRFDYNPSTLAAQGLLIEEQRTNSIWYSEQFNNVAGWAATGTAPTVTANTTTSPDGTLNADTVTFAAADSRLQNEAILSFTAGVSYTFTVFVKAVGASLNKMRLALFDGSQQNSTDFTVSNLTWTRITHTFVAANTTAVGRVQIRNATDNLANSLYFWGAQLEAGAFPTSYIPTTTTALTRAADVASVNTLSPWFNATEGTFYAESLVTYNTGSIFPASFSASVSGASTNQIMAYYIATNRVDLYVRTGGTIVADIGPTFTANTINKFAGAYKENDFAATNNGAAVSTDTSGALPSGINQLNLGAQAGGGFGILNGYLRRLTYYPRRLSNAELQAITA